MQLPGFNFDEDVAQGAAGDGRGLIRTNHEREFPAAVTPFFDGAVAPPDDQKALRLDCDLFGFRHDGLRTSQIEVLRVASTVLERSGLLTQMGTDLTR
jgi:hypothetical protein